MVSKGGDEEKSRTEIKEKIKAFSSNQFNPDTLVSNCETEKEIRHLCSSLRSLKKACAEELRGVYPDYTSFKYMTKEMTDLGRDILSIKNMLSAQIVLVHGLAKGVHIDSMSTNFEGPEAHDVSDDEDGEPSNIQKLSVEFPDMLDVLLAERRVDEAIDSLFEAEKMAAEARESKTLSSAALLSLQTAITDRRQRLADQLAESSCLPSISRAELRATVLAIKTLRSSPCAHSVLLNAHGKRLQRSMHCLCPSNTSYRQEYTAALSQLVFSTISQASTDSLALFDNDPANASEILTWSTKQVEALVSLLKTHTLPAGGLRAAVDCAQLALSFCSLLENHHLDLSSVLLELLRPSVEQALEASFKRIEKEIAASVMADNWELTYPPSGTQAHKSSNASLGSGIAYHAKLSSSAHELNLLVQDFIEDVYPIQKMGLVGPVLEGLFQVFSFYVNLLRNVIPVPVDDEGNIESTRTKTMRMAETEDQQIALLVNASFLADELLPRAAKKLAPLNFKHDPNRSSSQTQTQPDQREWRRRLHRCVDGLRDSFCRLHALDLIFTEDYDTRMSADMYISMDDAVDHGDWFPSPIFQELFIKLNRIARTAADMFAGRERYCTLLLMRLTETVILWLSDDNNFWDVIEGPVPLGPLGLQQFYLDMEFIIQFSSQGRYLSRHLRQVIKGNMDRALDAFSTSGIKLDSVLPGEDWFADVSQEAIYRLSRDSIHVNGDQDLYSPSTLSAPSIVSV